MNTLPAAEFDFSGVPDAELNSCLQYEYLRESEVIVREVKTLRTQLAERARVRGTNLLDALVGFKFTVTEAMDPPGVYFKAALFATLASVESFPDVPWQKLPILDKHELRDVVDKARNSDPRSMRKKEFPPLGIELLSKDPSIGETTLNAWKAKMTAHSITLPMSEAKKMFNTENLAPVNSKLRAYGFFKINLGYDHAHLLDAFADWLKVNHPGGSLKPMPSRGRKSVRDRLNALGALRLRHRFSTFAEAQKEMSYLKNRTHGMCYGDRRSFNRACKAGVNFFRTLLKLPQSAFPIHFKKGGQK